MTTYTTTTHRICREDREYIESHLERINGLLRSFLDGPDTQCSTLQDLIQENIEWGTDAILDRIDRASVETTITEYVVSDWKPPGCEPLNTHSRSGVSLISRSGDLPDGGAS